MALPTQRLARTAGLTSAISIFPSEFLSYFCMNAFIFSPKLSLFDTCGKGKGADFATGSHANHGCLPISVQQWWGSFCTLDTQAQNQVETMS